MEIGWSYWYKVAELWSTLLAHLGNNGCPEWRRITWVSVLSIGARMCTWGLAFVTTLCCGEDSLPRGGNQWYFNKYFQMSSLRKLCGILTSTKKSHCASFQRLKPYLKYEVDSCFFVHAAAQLLGFYCLLRSRAVLCSGLCRFWLPLPRLSRGVLSFRGQELCSMLSKRTVMYAWRSKPCHFKTDTGRLPTVRQCH